MDKKDFVRTKIPCEVYSRVSGYYRPVSNWNKGKQQEFKERKMMRIDEKIYADDINAPVSSDGKLSG